MSRNPWIFAFAAALALQFAVLYSPRTPGIGGGFPWDKVVHVSIFALVASLGVRAGIPMPWLAAGLIAQALASELIQGLLLPDRSGDAGDIAADLTGLAAGLFLGGWWLRRAGP